MKKLFTFTIFSISFISASQIPTFAPTQDLLAWYSFNGNVLDNSSNGHNSSNYNIVLTTDRYNTVMKALYFSGSGTEYLNYGDQDDFEGLIQLSFSFWLYPESHGSTNSELNVPIISKWAATTDLQGSSYNILMDGSDLSLILTDGTTNDTISSSLTNIPLNQWVHVVITSNYGFVKIYINNNLITEATTTISAVKSSDRDFKIGDWYKSDNSNFSAYQGKIDDIGIWSREIDACEVDALYTGNSCLSANIETEKLKERELVHITNLMGKETTHQQNTVLIYVYSDGTKEKVLTIE